MKSCIAELKRIGFDPTLNNPIVCNWIRLGRHRGPLYFEISRPSTKELRSMAHLLAANHPDRRFKYGLDNDGDPFIEVSIAP